MKILCVFGEHNYGDATRGKSYEYSNFLPALCALGHEVIHFESWDKTNYLDFFDLNQSLIDCVERESPDIIFFVIFSYEIWLETLCEIRRRCSARLINWSTDDSWRFDELSRLISPYFDLYVTTYVSAVRSAECLGYENFHLSQWAAPASHSENTVRAEDCQYQVSFIGTAYGPRRQLINDLLKAGIQVECFGFGWPNGSIPYERMKEVIRRSIISLNFSDPGQPRLGDESVFDKQIKARVFEVLGLGGFVLTEYAPGLENYFIPDQEIVVFEDREHLPQTIRRVLSDAEWRDRMAVSGHDRVVREHTYESRFTDILNALANATRIEIPNAAVKSFSDLKQQHRMTFPLYFLKWSLVLPLLPVFGLRRARRAARRFIYGASWRIFGERTYRAQGLPGRMFYSDS